MKVAATIMVKKPGAMTRRGRADIAKWLRKQAAKLVKDGHLYVHRSNYRAAFTYLEDK